MRPRHDGRLREPTMRKHGWLLSIMLTLVIAIKVRMK